MKTLKILVADAMTKHPYTIDFNDSLDSALNMMERYRIRHLPVIEKDQLISVLSQREIITALALTKGWKGAAELSVSDAWSIEAYIVESNYPLRRVLREMVRRHIGSALVTHEKELVGIFTSIDACTCYAEMLRELEC
jgi:CBS domain-containing protein